MRCRDDAVNWLFKVSCAINDFEYVFADRRHFTKWRSGSDEIASRHRMALLRWFCIIVSHSQSQCLPMASLTSICVIRSPCVTHLTISLVVTLVSSYDNIWRKNSKPNSKRKPHITVGGEMCNMTNQGHHTHIWNILITYRLFLFVEFTF